LAPAHLLLRSVPRLPLSAGVAVQQSIDIFWPTGPQQQTCSSGVRPNAETDWQTK